jgi:hypothetical protein
MVCDWWVTTPNLLRAECMVIRKQLLCYVPRAATGDPKELDYLIKFHENETEQ